MPIANLFIVVVIAGCAAYQYLKGTFVKSFAMVIISVCATIVAFGYYEVLAGVFISRSDNSRFASIVPWTQPLCLILLFVLTFGILQTILAQLSRQAVVLGLTAERAGRVICGVFMGLIFSSVLITALAMGPLPYKYPYPRFDKANPDVENPRKPLFSVDGFASGLFNMVSRGCFSGKRSFGTLHANFLDQVFLNRHIVGSGISLATSLPAIELYEIQKKATAWPAPEGLTSAKDPNELIQPRSGHNLTVVRVGIRKKAADDAGSFVFSQLRIVCKPEGSTPKRLGGRGKAVYPFGYLKQQGQLQRIKRLNQRVYLKRGDFTGKVKWIDFVFELPNDFLPVLVEFKQNNVVEVVSFVPADQAPPAVYFSNL